MKKVSIKNAFIFFVFTTLFGSCLLPISMPKNKTIDMMFLQYFWKLLERFPIFELILREWKYENENYSNGKYFPTR